MRISKNLVVGAALLLFWSLPVQAAPAIQGNGQPEQHQVVSGWEFPGLGFGRGTREVSVGVFLWKNEFHLRNLQYRSDIDLWSGVRLHSITRSNEEWQGIKRLRPYTDEGYIEGFGFHHDPAGVLSASVRVGRTRYLHFPYPDGIAVFDQVPGIGDLRGGVKTGYSGVLGTLDYAHRSGIGVHATALNWGFGQQQGDKDKLLEDYVYVRHNLGVVHMEAHVGGLLQRPEPLGYRQQGYNVFAGIPIGSYQLGLLYEKLHNNPAYTGIMVTFPSDRVTRALGSVAFDYDRTPQGLALQIPVWSGTTKMRKKAPLHAQLVGEVTAERLKTYWQNGMARNFYEHRLSSWGQTSGPGLIVVMEEQPWYLQAEALVSPHTKFSSKQALKDWEHDRMGPAQLSQRVVYKFYRVG